MLISACGRRRPQTYLLDKVTDSAEGEVPTLGGHNRGADLHENTSTICELLPAKGIPLFNGIHVFDRRKEQVDGASCAATIAE